MANISFEWDKDKNSLNKKNMKYPLKRLKQFFPMKMPCFSMTRVIHMRRIDLYFLV